MKKDLYTPEQIAKALRDLEKKICCQVATFGENFANTDLVLTGARSHDLDGNNLHILDVGGLSIIMSPGDDAFNLTTAGGMFFRFGADYTGFEISAANQEINIAGSPINLITADYPSGLFRVINEDGRIFMGDWSNTVNNTYIQVDDFNQNILLNAGGVVRFGTVPAEYADDAAAAVGGLQIGDVYRTGSILKVRVA